MPLTARRVLRTFRYAMFFDGIDDYVRTDSAVRLSTPLTVVAWFSHIDKFNILTLVANSTAGIETLGFRFFVNRWRTQDRALSVEVGTGTSGSNITSPPNAVQPCMWNNAAAVVNGPLSQLWLNKQMVLSKDLHDFEKTDYVYVGTMAGTFYFFGYIAQVIIYSRALSGSEIQWNYLYPDNPIRNGLVLWLKADPNYIKDVDGDGVLEWLDLSGFGNHGKIYGATLVKLIRDPVR
jgi:hypothetical protein